MILVVKFPTVFAAHFILVLSVDVFGLQAFTLSAFLFFDEWCIFCLGNSFSVLVVYHLFWRQKVH